MQVYNSMQFSDLLPATVTTGGEYAFPLPRWLVGALTTPSLDETPRVNPIRLKLTFTAALEEEFATWDQLSDEAFLAFEASLE